MINFKAQNSTIIYTSKFFLSGQTLIHQRIVYTVWNLLSDFGGITGIIIPVIIFLNSPLSYVCIMAKLIGKIYYHRPRQFTN